MAFDQALRLTSILLASASFIGLALGAGLPNWLTIVTGLALIVALLRTLGIGSIEQLVKYVPLSPTTWNILGIFGFFGFWADMMWISGDLLHAGVHFLLILMVIKLFNLQLRRDYLHLYAISLMALLASASVTTDLWYLLIFLAYLLSGVWALMLFQLTKRGDEAGVPSHATSLRLEPHESWSRVTPQLFWVANGMAVGALGLTIVIFFAIPRINTGFYQRGIGDNIRTSGFSDKVNLGAIGPIKRDPSVVMRVELSDGGEQEVKPFYVRGMTFDRYDGRSWTNQLNHRRVLSEYTPGTFTVRRTRSRSKPSLGHVVRQNILLEALDTPVLFASPFVESVNGRFPAVEIDPSGALYLPYPNSSRIEYSVISRSNPVLAEDREPQATSYPEGFIRHYLQLPGQSERIGALAREIADSKRANHEKIVAIREYLAHNYRYSLDAPLAGQSSPLEEFLFTRKTGYCEHYATAMVIMLRAVGVPARLVTGFLSSEWNEYGNYYLVRQQDAHAWVEAHLPHSGWVTVDPTPASGETIASSPSAWQAFGRILDNFRLRWNRFFVQYSADDQLAVVRELKAGGTSIKNFAWGSLAAVVNPLTSMIEQVTRYASKGNLLQLAGFLGLIAIGIGVLFWVVWVRPWTSRFSKKDTPRDELVMTRLYRRMIDHLARRGVARPLTMAPLEFIGFAQVRWKEAGFLVTTITEFYCRSRFGHRRLTDEELHTAEDCFQRLIALG